MDEYLTAAKEQVMKRAEAGVEAGRDPIAAMLVLAWRDAALGRPKPGWAYYGGDPGGQRYSAAV